MLGYAAYEFFKRKNYDVAGLSRKDFDVLKSDLGALKNFIKEKELIINCIGIIKPTIAKNTETDVLKVNSVFPRNLAIMCKTSKVKLIHVTTDCVFSGKRGNYNELDFYDANDIYGISKSCGDISECMVLRTSFVGPEKGTNRSLFEWTFSQRGKQINGFTNHRWNGISTLNFAEVCEQILDKGLYEERIFHIHSPNVITKYELLKIFNDVFELNLTIMPIESAELCDRSLSSIYELSSKVCTKPIIEQVRELKTFFRL